MKTAALIYTRGDRPQFFQQALQLLDRQSVKPDIRYVIDDQPKSNDADLVWRVKKGIAQALRDEVTHLFFWEDDEYYAPNYIETMLANWSNDISLLGVSNIAYYHLRTGRRIEKSFPHACLSATAITLSMMKGFKFPSDKELLFDVYLWKWAEAYGVKSKTIQQADHRLVIGMKHGVGGHHGPHSTQWPGWQQSVLDTEGEWLKQRIDEASVSFYLADWKKGPVEGQRVNYLFAGRSGA